jgi:hypothetical protein
VEDLLSTLQHMRQIHPGSPFSTMTTVRFLLPALVRGGLLAEWNLHNARGQGGTASDESAESDSPCLRCWDVLV